jgi:hypothetical protein
MGAPASPRCKTIYPQIQFECHPNSTQRPSRVKGGLPSVTLLAYGINNANHTGWLPAHFFHHAFFECGQKRKKHHQGYAGSNPHEDGRDQMNIPKTVCHRSDLFQPADYSPFR